MWFLGLVLYSRGSGGSGPAQSHRRFNRRSFRREASAIGLTALQIRLLEGFIRTYQVHRPLKMLSNTREMNITLGKALRDINHMEAKETVY